MPSIRLVALLLSMCSPLAIAAPAAYLTLDHSTASLMDAATSRAMWKDVLPARLLRVYPEKKWGFVSEVEGGFDDARVCVVTARAMMLPRSGKTLVFAPTRTATAFGALPGASAEQCRALAKAKLNEAASAVVSALIAR